jgi:hypothetical protein
MSKDQQFQRLKDHLNADLQVNQITEANLLRGDADMQLDDHLGEFAGSDLPNKESRTATCGMYNTLTK